MKVHLKRLSFFVFSSLSLLIIIGGGFIHAYTSGNYGSGAYGSCEYGQTCSITVSSNGNVSLNIVPAAGGKCTIQSDTASVTTDDTNGYTLTLADSSNNTSLVNGSDLITASSGTLASPTTLTANKWGYRVDGLGSFGSGPTTNQTNISIPATTFAGIMASNQPADTIATSSGAADPAQSTTVWYGACADTSLKSGSYNTQVLYTAVAN